MRRADIEHLTLIEEAAIACEAAERDFEELNQRVHKTLRESRRLTETAILDEERARRRLLDARVRLSDRLHRRDPKAVSACFCKGQRWVCEAHPAVALDECACGAASVPCSCNPKASPPPGFESVADGAPRRARRWIVHRLL